ncbi:RING/U-box superfamily protein [Abeliophyllum distichum]|uniref:RING-type E3 ubiquitin transferase n=1 Tax=Abeliophyllum distichum TaxID=126358 RepID=A0ABD1PBT6_9LAMI
MPRLFNHHAYWCHECDMSIGLPPSPTRNALLCPHCHHDSLEQMDSPSPTIDTPTHPALTAPDDNFLLTSPYLHRLIHRTAPTAPTANSHSNPAPKYVIDSLQEITITQELLDDDPNMLCPVCKDPFRVNASMKLMPCKHTYHADCIVAWLEINNSCPVCRFRLPTNEEKYGEGLDGGERYVGFVRLEELVDDEVDLYGFRNTLRHIMRRHRRDEEGIMEENIASGSQESFFSPTQIGEVERGEGVLERENSVETVSSWPRGLVEEGGGGGGRNGDVLL